MQTLNGLTLVINGLTLSLALGFLLIILWHDARKQLNQFFAIFLALVVIWNTGSLLVQLALLLSEIDVPFSNFAFGIMEIGFTGSSVGVYILTTILVGAQTRRLRLLAFTSLGIVVGYRILLIVINNSPYAVNENADLTQQTQPLFTTFYLFFDIATLYLVWRYRRKIDSRGISLGILIFVLGQSLSFINPDLVVASFATTVGSVGALIICFALLQQEIITPLSERSSQVEAIHKVSLAITSQLAINMVLNEIAIQAAGWVGADGAGIFLVRGNSLELVAVYDLPRQILHTRISFGQGVAGSVAARQRSIRLENYGRDWKQVEDFALARETFGSVICVPLTSSGQIIGVLMVVAGRQGRLFDEEDTYVLELLAAQAAVAISHSHLFEEQKALTQQVEAAHSQLETVLTSTDNPVIAVDRRLKLIFANVAARRLFKIEKRDASLPVTKVFPSTAFPSNYREALRKVKHEEGYVYEIVLDNRAYLCHLAAIGKPRIDGWVAVLNDITQLKELDRLKSEMVRMASHDLKNPLMGAMAYAELLIEDLEEAGNVDMQQAVVVIQRQLERMGRIIRGILDLERIRTVTQLTELCQPGLIVKNCVDELEYMIEDRHVQIDVNVETNVQGFWGNREQFERALVNLVENAIKFSLEESHVWINVSQEGERIVFAIRDNGVGIPIEVQAKVFDRFFRGQQKGVEHVSGSGLGLSLVKTIVDNHKGHIWLESHENDGTIFYIEVPAVLEDIGVSYSQ